MPVWWAPQESQHRGAGRSAYVEEKHRHGAENVDRRQAKPTGFCQGGHRLEQWRGQVGGKPSQRHLPVMANPQPAAKTKRSAYPDATARDSKPGACLPGPYIPYVQRIRWLT